MEYYTEAEIKKMFPEVKKTSQTLRTFNGRVYERQDVYLIPKKYIKFNPWNGRISQDIEKKKDGYNWVEYEALDVENQEEIRNDLMDVHIGDFKHLKSDIDEVGEQKTPGIVAVMHGKSKRNHLVLADGNLRLTSLYELSKKDPVKWESVAFKAVIITRKNITRSILKVIEAKAQHAEVGKSSYNAVQLSIDIYEWNRAGTHIKDIAKDMRIKEGDVKNHINTVKVYLYTLGSLGEANNVSLLNSFKPDGPTKEIVKLGKETYNLIEKKHLIHRLAFYAYLWKGDSTKEIREIARPENKRIYHPIIEDKDDAKNTIRNKFIKEVDDAHGELKSILKEKKTNHEKIDAIEEFKESKRMENIHKIAEKGDEIKKEKADTRGHIEKVKDTIEKLMRINNSKGITDEQKHKVLSAIGILKSIVEGK